MGVVVGGEERPLDKELPRVWQGEVGGEGWLVVIREEVEDGKHLEIPFGAMAWGQRQRQH